MESLDTKPQALMLYLRDNMHDTTKRGSDLLILLVLTFLGLLTRGYGLADWDIIGDEYFTVHFAHERYKSLNNPAYYALVMGSFKLFGMSEWSARLPAMLLGLSAIPVFYLTWRNVIGRNAAIIGAAFIILSSWHLWLSQFSRFYTGVFLFASLSYYFYYQALRLASYRLLALAFAANAIGFLFHVTVAMVPLACGAFSLVVVAFRRRAEPGFSARIATIHLLVLGVAGLAALPLLWSVGSTWSGMGQMWGYGPAKTALVIAKFVQIPIAMTALLGAVMLLQKDVFKGTFFMLGIGLPIVAAVIGASVMAIRPHYVFYTVPLVIVMAAFLCEEVRAALARYRFAAHALTALLIAGLLPSFVSHYIGRASLDSREAVAFIESSYRPGDRIVSFSKQFRHYGDHKFYIEPKIGDQHFMHTGWQEALKPYEEGIGRVWIVLKAERKPLAKGLEHWLLRNARLVWRKFETRFDYEIRGMEIFLVDAAQREHGAHPAPFQTHGAPPTPSRTDMGQVPWRQ